MRHAHSAWDPMACSAGCMHKGETCLRACAHLWCMRAWGGGGSVCACVVRACVRACGMRHAHSTWDLMACSTGRMRRGVPVRPLCGRAGRCQAGGGRMSTSRALDMLARGMASCMYIEHGMRNVACMKTCVTATAGGSAHRFAEHRRNRRCLESEALSSDACP
jgi:hypothetical protein